MTSHFFPTSDEMVITQDHILGGQIVLYQPADGYRIAIDPVFLAASIKAKAGETVLDVGAGVGAASLCLAKRVGQLRITGVEIQRPYVRLATHNIQANDFGNCIEIIQADLQHPPPRLAAASFSHIMANPPFIEATKGSISTQFGKARANHELDGSLAQWVRFCLLMVRPRGTVTFIYRADRLDELLANLVGKLGCLTIFPLWPKNGRRAKRVIVQGIRSIQGPLLLCNGMVLHNTDGSYTAHAQEILRYGHGLELHTFEPEDRNNAKESKRLSD